MVEELDFLYVPSRDVARDLWLFTEVLEGELVFAIEAFGARVAEVRIGRGGPRLLLADHLEADGPVLVYRVADLDVTLTELERRGWVPESRFGIPHGPCASFRVPGGQRLAFYELSRPHVDEGLSGRVDFRPEP